MRTPADQTMVGVPLKNGSTWTGTEAQLRREHPTWVRSARIVQPTRSTHDDYASDVLTEIEQDYADDPRPGRLPTSARTYGPVSGQKQRVRYEYRPDTPIQRRRSAPTQTGSGTRETEDIPQARTVRKRRGIGLRAHPFLYLGVGMLALWVVLSALVSWWNTTQDDWKYGRPRTYQFDAMFGHNDSAANPTHIIIVNLSRHIIIIELPGGDPGHSRIYSGPTLFQDGGDLLPVTGKAIDVNGDGKLDLVLYVQDQRIVFINDGTQFRPVKSGEQITIPK
jgi:hypothetical protein